MKDSPCGFPIVTQKRSTSKFKISTYDEDDHDLGNGCNGFSHQNGNGSCTSTINSSDMAQPTSYTVPIRGNGEGDNRSHGAKDSKGTPIKLSTIEIDHDHNFNATMTIRYFDIVNKEYEDLANGNGHHRNNSEQGRSHEKILMTTTVTTVADVYIHISLVNQPFHSSASNAASTQRHRIVLSATTSTRDIDSLENEEEISHEYQWSDVEPQVTFSANGNYLACIIPRPIRKHQDNTNVQTDDCGSIAMVSIKPAGISTLAIFNLEPQKIEYRHDEDDASADYDELPLPPYLQPDISFENDVPNERIDILPPIATNPLIVALNPLPSNTTAMNDLTADVAKLLSQITCLCDMNHNEIVQNSRGTFKDAPLLLAGCSDGSIITISYKRAIVLGMLYRVRGSNTNSIHQKLGWDTSAAGLRALKYNVEQRQVKGEIKGRLLCVQRGGRVAIFSTQFQDMMSRVTRTEEEEEKKPHSAPLHCLIWESKKYAFKMVAEPLKKTVFHSSSSCVVSARYVNVTFIDFNTIATVLQPLHSNGQGRDVKFDDVVAQVWSINESSSRGTKLIAELSLDCDKLEEMQHGFFDHHQAEKDSPSHTCSILSMPTFIGYDKATGCLSIGSVVPLSRGTKRGKVEARAFISFWDWTTCTIAFTLASAYTLHFSGRRSKTLSEYPIFLCDETLVSRHYFHTKSGALTMEHTHGSASIYQRDLYNVGVLSPSRCRRSVRCLEDQNPIFLSEQYIMHPGFSQPTVNKEIQVEWKRSMLPPSYTLTNGPIVTASLSDRVGKSLAIVGSRGLCVLDMHKDDGIFNNETSCVEGFHCQVEKFQLKTRQDRWRMFQKRDEQSFIVKAMTWWEQFNGSSEDVIVCVIQYVDGLDPNHYLVAWSSRSLRMGQSQLVCNFRNNSDDDGRGFRLPCDLSPEQMSILVKPGKFSDRAVISVAGNLLGVGQFSILQLQVCEGDGNDMGDRILAIDAVQGTIPLTTSPCDCIFLAFCSYQFDLLNRNVVHSRSIATLGVLHNHGTSLSGVAIHSEDAVQCAKIAELNTKTADSNMITKFWLDDFAASPNYNDGDSCTDTWTWSFMNSNGGIFSWALGDHLVQADFDPLQFALHRSVSRHFQNDDALAYRYSFGVKSDEKRSLKGSIVDERTILLGPLPSMDHRYLLYTGQKAKDGHRTGLPPKETFGLFGVSDFDVGIPSSTGSILMALSLTVEYYFTGQEQMAENMMLQICSYIQLMHNSETIFAGLRAIISFLTELISKKERRDESEEIKRKRFLKATQAALVRITVSSLVQVQFISLFLNVGRQLEPHHFKSLFPLSLSFEEENSDHLSLQDLFDMAVADGSFSVPGAALPLFGNKKLVHGLCVNLLHHCINKVIGLSDGDVVNVKCIREECRSIQQLYEYIIKVEDSERALQLSLIEQSSSGSEKSDDSASSIESDSEESSGYTSSGDEYSMVNSVTDNSFVDHLANETKSAGRLSALASLLVNPLLSSKQHQKEKAISEAASTFILSSYSNDALDGLVSRASSGALSEPEFESESDSDSESSVLSNQDISAYFEFEDRAAFSASGVVAMAISSAVFFIEEISPRVVSKGLQNIATLCLLLRNDNESMTFPSPSSIAIKTLIGKIADYEFVTSMQALDNMTLKREHLVCSGAPETIFIATDFMEILLTQGCNLWDAKSSEAVINIISKIILRGEHAPEIKVFTPLLSMLLVVACHVAEKSAFLIDNQSDCALAELYRTGLLNIKESH